jgi:hypothetical protein
VPVAIIGPKMVEFHSKSGLAVAPAKVALKQNGGVQPPIYVPLVDRVSGTGSLMSRD